MKIPNFASSYHAGTWYFCSDSHWGRKGPSPACRSTSFRISLRAPAYLFTACCHALSIAARSGRGGRANRAGHEAAMRIESATNVLRGRTGRHACSTKGKRTCVSVISAPAAAEKPQADSRLVSNYLYSFEADSHHMADEAKDILRVRAQCTTGIPNGGA